MWRFLNSIPRAFRHHLHGPRASVGVHVDDDRNEKDLAETQFKGTEANTSSSESSPEQEHSQNLKQESCCNSRGFFERWIQHGHFTNPSICINNDASQYGDGFSDQDSKKPFWSFHQGSHNAVEGLTVGSALTFGHDAPKSKKTRLLHRVLFAVQGQTAVTLHNNNRTSPLTLQNDSFNDNNCKAIKDAAGAAHDADVNKVKSETVDLDSAMKGFEDMCVEYTAQSESLLGLEAAQKGKMSEAVSHLQTACSCGNVSACFNLGLCYETGTGVPQSLEKAEHYYRVASDGGHELASYNLGLMYLSKADGSADSEADIEEGIKLLEVAAQAGMTEAQKYLGMYHMEEKDDPEKAVPYFKSAAGLNDKEAQYLLGICFEQGIGVEMNECRAAQLYSMAAGGGHAAAMYNLGVFNEQGMGGIPEDRISAVDLYLKAAVLGNEHAQQRLDEIKAQDEFEASMKSDQQEHKGVTRDSIADISLASLPEKKEKLVISPSASSPCFIGQFDDLMFSPWNFSLAKPKDSTPQDICVKISMSEKSHAHFYFADSDAENMLSSNSKGVNVRGKKPFGPPPDLKDMQPSDVLATPMPLLHHSHTTPSLSSLVDCK